jgi:hypothetical protein
MRGLEQIGDVGLSELNAVHFYLRQVLAHLLELRGWATVDHSNVDLSHPCGRFLNLRRLVASRRAGREFPDAFAGLRTGREPAEQVALHPPAAQMGEQSKLLLGFHTLPEYVEPQRSGHCQDSLNQSPRLRIAVQRAQKAAVDFHHVERGSRADNSGANGPCQKSSRPCGCPSPAEPASSWPRPRRRQAADPRLPPAPVRSAPDLCSPAHTG